MTLVTRLLAAGAVATAAVLAAAGCSSTPADSPSPTSATRGVEHVRPGDAGVRVIAALDDQRRSSSLAPFTGEREYTFVYLSCRGAGEVIIAIDSVGRYPVPCEQARTGSLNQFQTGVGSTVQVTVESEPGQNWAVTVAESDRDL